MKVIFESEEEKRQFMEAGCPCDIPTIVHGRCDTDYEYIEGVCEECWKNCEIILEVEHE